LRASSDRRVDDSLEDLASLPNRKNRRKKSATGDASGGRMGLESLRRRYLGVILAAVWGLTRKITSSPRAPASHRKVSSCARFSGGSPKIFVQ